METVKIMFAVLEIIVSTAIIVILLRRKQKMKNNQKSKRSKTEIAVSVSVDTTELDIALEKANRLMEILQEAERLRDSIFNKDGKETGK